MNLTESLALSAIIISVASPLLQLYIKTVLEHKNAREIARLGNELSFNLEQFKTQFTNVTQRRMEVIGELSLFLYDASSKAQKLSNSVLPEGITQVDVTIDDISKAYFDCRDYYTKHRVFLSLDSCDNIDKVIKILEHTLTV